MKSFGTITKESITKVDDRITKVERKKVGFFRDGSFVKIYDDGIKRMFKLDVNERNVILAMIGTMNYGCEVRVALEDRTKYAETMGVKINTFDHYYYELLKTDFIFKTGSTTIMVNPFFIAKGRPEDVLETRKSVVKVSDDKYVLFSSLPEDEQRVITEMRKTEKKHKNKKNEE